MTLNVSSKLGKLLVLRTIPGKIPQILRKTEVKMATTGRVLLRTARIQYSRFATALVDRRVFPRAFESIRVTTVKNFFRAKSFVRPFSKISFAKMIGPKTSFIRSAIPRFGGRSRAEINSNREISVKSLSRIPISELTYPIKEISNLPNEMVRVLDEFSRLPMWFTMPVIFVASVALGAFVSVLV